MKFIKNNSKLIIGLIIGMVLSGTTVYAATQIMASEVLYDNTTSGLTSTNVQDAVDELTTRANTLNNTLTSTQSSLQTCQGDLSTKTTDYNTCSSSLTTAQGDLQTCQTALSQPPTDSAWVSKYNTLSGTPTNYEFGSKPTKSSTADADSLNKTVYLGLYSDNGLGVCAKIGGTQHCFRSNNWIAEKQHLIDVFGSSNCSVSSSRVDCGASDFSCYVYSNGRVDCFDRGTDAANCSVYGGGTVYCE